MWPLRYDARVLGEGPMQSTMQPFPLTIAGIFRHGRAAYGDSEVVTLTEEGVDRARFADVAERVTRLASALARLGVRPGDRVATFMWNSRQHLEAYLAVPSMGAVLHTLNLRLAPAEVAYIISHAEDKVILVDADLVPVLARALPLVTRKPERFVVIGKGADARALGDDVRDYDALLADAPPAFDWPALDENSAAAMCYTSGTTGQPKGVVYSHRSTYLHSMAQCMGNVLAVCERDIVLPFVPMFHANAWGLPYAAWMCGADLALPSRFMTAAGLCRLIGAVHPTILAGVPTLFRDMLAHGDANPVDLSSVRAVLCGGSAVPEALIARFEERFGVPIFQGWGMTETSPLAALSVPPKRGDGRTSVQYRTLSGRILPGVELRIVDDAGAEQPWDGTAEGEIEVRGPWVTTSYYGEPTPEKFHDGWLRTGDVGTVERTGFIRITDRAKDVIKSGGEWISSVALENAIMAYPAVAEAAVIGVPDDKWGERPLACVVKKPGQALDVASLCAHLDGKVARWWLPERWTFVDEVPKTSVGKFDKKVLRARYARGELAVETR
jgi:fatty-acyl-CoA synthase